MSMKKILSAALSACMTAGAVLSAGPLTTFAADPELIFDIRSGEKNELTYSVSELANGNVTVPVSIYVPSNPGICAASLKLQVNDGQVDKDGAFGNYGFSFSDGKLANPYCFDSANKGDSTKAFSGSGFNFKQMNLTWVASQTLKENADANAEAGTYAWDKSVSWAYQYALAEGSLVIPKGTAAGTYVLDIRTEQYLNGLSVGKENAKYSQSRCKAAGKDEAVKFKSVPLTIRVTAGTTSETSTTTTTTATTTATTKTTSGTSSTTTSTTTSTTKSSGSTDTTTSTSATSSTTTTTTTGKTTTSDSGSTTTTTTTNTNTSTSATTTSTTVQVTGDPWEKKYNIENGGHYLIIGEVCGTPGEEVDVPVMVYGDSDKTKPGTAGLRLAFSIGKGLELTDIYDEETYHGSKEPNAALDPATFVFASATAQHAAEGAKIISLSCKIPENAAVGTVYDVKFFRGTFSDTSGKNKIRLEVCDINGADIETKFYDGSVTVVQDKKTVVPNRTSVTFSEPDQTVNLTLHNAVGDVTWSSDKPEVAKVDENGFVTAVAGGTAIITADNGGNKYKITVIVGLFGDVDANGEISVEDAQMTLDEYVKTQAKQPSVLTDDQKKIADVTGDGAVSVDDAQCILNYYTTVVLGKSAKDNWYTITGNPKAPGAP